MGSAKSKSAVRNRIDQNIVNTNEINVLNEQINELVSNTTMNLANSCSAATGQIQRIDFSDCKAGGDIIIDDIKQKQLQIVSFDCIQASELNNDVSNGILNEMMAAIDTNFSTDAIAEMTSEAKASAKSGFISGRSRTDTSVDNDIQFSQVNRNRQDIQNVLKNHIANNYTVDVLNSCENAAQQKQIVDFSACQAGGDIRITDIGQDQTQRAITDCVQNSGIANQIVTRTAQNLGLEVETVAETKTKATSDARATGTAVAEGIMAGSSASSGSLISIAIIGVVLFLAVKLDLLNVDVQSAFQGNIPAIIGIIICVFILFCVLNMFGII